MKFGADNIGICMGGEEGCGVMMFFEQNPEVTGPHSYIGYARTSDFPVSMTFSDTESLDELIRSLFVVKEVMEGRLLIHPFESDRMMNVC